MKIVPNDYCNECRRNTDLIVTGVDEHSVFAKCPYCGAKFDLIYVSTRIKEVESLPRKITAIYTASDDPDFGEPIEDIVTLIAPDLLMEEEGNELVFLVIPKVGNEQAVVEVDRAKCGYFSLRYDRESLELDYDFLTTCSFLDFIRKFVVK